MNSFTQFTQFTHPLHKGVKTTKQLPEKKHTSTQIKVSAFRNVYSDQPHDIDLTRWLKGIPKYDQIIACLRSCGDDKKRKQIKRSLPCFIPAGVFSQPKDECLKKFSGVMCFDFDHLPDTKAIKQQIIQNPHVYYAGLSAGGHGLFALVSVARDAIGRWREYYKALGNGFGPVSDYVDLKCTNISRRRFYSHDPEPFFNPHALDKPFTLPWLDKEQTRVLKHNYLHRTTDHDKTINRLVVCIERDKADITADYNHWISIGGTLANIMGEQGREYFHRISQFYPGYNPQEVDRQYDYSLGQPPDFGIGIILDIAKKNNVLLKSGR